MIEYPAKPLGVSNANDYIDIVFQLASQNLPLKDIAYLCRCSLSTLKQLEPIIIAIRFGWAEYRLKVESELFAIAVADPNSISDVSERIAVRNSKIKALVEIKRFLEKRDEFLENDSGGEVKKLTDAELAQQLQKFVDKMSSRA
jgi:hypothetical protein